ncbi:MAG TPA: MFS transporter [Dehalococcoidia bacterium]|nr:MFS transporter [Dehalococcoidia bacterium]
MPNRLPAVPVYLLMTGCNGLFFATYATVATVYRVVEAGLSPFQVVLVGTVLEASAFLGEIPTGVVADVYSRRLSIIIGLVLIGLGFMVEGLFPTFGVILAAQVIWGVGYTFTSGAREAWIADEVGEDRVAGVFLRAAQVGQLGALAGIGLSVAIASADLGTALVVGGIGYVAMAAFLALFMAETGFSPTPAPERSSWGKMTATFEDGIGVVRRSAVLPAILAIAAIAGAASEGLDRLTDVHFLQNYTFPELGGADPIVWFGLISAGALLMSIAAAEFARRFMGSRDSSARVRLLVVFNSVLVAAVCIFGLAAGFYLALAAYWAARVMRQTMLPLQAAWLNEHVDSKVRATVFSMAGQFDAGGQIVGGPFIGLLANVASVRAALVAAGLALLPSLPLYARGLRNGRAASEEVAST